MKKLYAIGDIHGCFNAMMKLLVKIGEDKGDDEAVVVFMGDYVDRGPDSDRVIDALIKLQAYSEHGDRKTKYVFLRGNHEDMMLNKDQRSSWLYNGGKETIASYDHYGEEAEKIRQIHVDWLKNNLVYWHRATSGGTDYLFVHGGFAPYMLIKDIDSYKDDILWMRDYNKYNGVFDQNVKVIHGHTPIAEPLKLSNQLNIDTGCVFGRDYSEYGNLTAVSLHNGYDNLKFFQTREVDLNDGH